MEYSTLTYAKVAENDSSKNKKSDLNYNLLGLLIEEVSGKSFDENLLDYSNRLSLSDTYFQRTDSTHDAKGYLHYNYRGKGLELRESPTYDLEAAFSSRGIKSSAVDLSKIIHSQVEKNIGVFGYLPSDGFSYSVVNNPKTQIAIIVLSNRRHPVAKEISNSIEAILENKEYSLPLPRKQVDIDINLLKDYSGIYSLNKNINFEVINENDSLYVVMEPNKIHLVPQSSNQFYMEQMDASMRFLRDSANEVSEVMLLDGFLEGNKVKRTGK
jgi:CubicO group peptidase (beta-lactamase class C family)